MKKLAITAACALTAVSACGGAGSEKKATPKPEVQLAALSAVKGCDELAEVIRENARQEMNQRLDANLAGYLASEGGCILEDAAADTSSGGANGAAPGAPEDVSATNNQVAGVDEADLVKTDGHYLYITTRGALHIVEAWPAASTKEIARVELEGDPRKLFVQGDRALVYVAQGEASAAECTYAYDCDFAGDGTSTRIVLLDISDRTRPKQLRELTLSGSLLAARSIGSAVHTVVTDAPVLFEGLLDFPESLDYCDSNVNELEARIAFEKLRKKNEDIIAHTDVLAHLPQLRDSASGKTSLLASCEGYYRTALAQGASFTTIVSLDLGGEESARTATVVSRPGAVYASEGALYLAVRDTSNDVYGYSQDENDAPLRESSVVHRFRIGKDPASTAYTASGTIPGHVLSQFAMDEHDGKLRVATSIGRVPDPRVHSAVTVLEQHERALEVVGQVDGIAPDEDIRAVRFDGDRGFIVTFKKTDPLFVLDLSNPKKPSVQGELKIPGFSTYMHMLDDTHLLTIGYDADDQGDFAWFAGVMLQIFDVSNPSAPKLVDKSVIGTRGSSSEALTNHLAFNYFAKKKVLAFPLHICEGGSGGEFGTEMTFSGLMVYDVDAQKGLDERGRVAHPHADGSFDSFACNNWWTNATSDVKRSVIMDDFIYSISLTELRVQSLSALGADLAVVSLAGSHCTQDGIAHEDGATWTTADCSVCQCDDGQVRCGGYDPNCQP